MIADNHHSNFPFHSQQFNALTKALSPAFMRWGGTSADQTIYVMNGSISDSKVSHASNETFYLNLTLFSDLANFALENKLKFVFGLNEQRRTSSNRWNSTNAQQLFKAIQASNKQNGDDPYVYAFELGNEPNLYKGNVPYGFTVVSPQQEAQDFYTLYNLVQTEFGKDKYIPKIWGNDGADAHNQDYTNQWAQAVNSMNNTNQIYAVTFHQYYGGESSFNLSSYISVQLLDDLIIVIKNVTNISVTNFGKNKPVIIGETAASSGGGAANITDTFIDGFMWLDKLGISSIYGIYAVCRQTLWSAHYALINPAVGGGNNDENNNLTVTPDYWSSYLFKNLVGNKIIYVDGEYEYNRYLRVYAFCTRTMKEGSIFDYPLGSVTIMILNLYNTSQMVQFNVSGVMNNNPEDMSYDLYHLECVDNIINSKGVLLNGELLKMNGETTFPEIKPMQYEYGTSIKFTSLSYGFVVVANASVITCS